ncbi:HAD family phosphatase [Fulvivirgaceae bacterium PWU20]|uniref:HAD family phosphatase n=1 Tax=Chryseosolibacter indicus TaxID=2782351 RepID=A0ABS5VQ33_9BACT|nr:HAD family phosphatase [Chryseosolibacter indicus]MBT1703560.1 HAD family phosphatase [Chryseosolibacter indicus]
MGGVILDLSVDHTLSAFSQLSKIDKDTVKRIFGSSPEFDLYEKGLLDDGEFRNFIRTAYNVIVADHEIDRCWNAMLLGIPLVKLNLLKRLQQSYSVFLLSNTNNIHLDYINNTILHGITGERLLDNYFHKAYYSQRMKKRKPEPEIFIQVLEENMLVPSQTLFLDDNALNIQSADKVGIKTAHITNPDLVLEIFESFI